MEMFTCVLLTFRESSGGATYQERNLNVSPEVHELYIELMCKKQPANTYGYVRTAEGYRLEETLEVSLGAGF